MPVALPTATFGRPQARIYVSVVFDMVQNAPAVHGLENLRPDLKDTPSASTLPSHAQHKPQAPSMPPPSSTPPALQQKIAQQQQANFASAAPSTAQARAKGLTLPQQQQSACSANDESAAAGDPSTSGYALSTSAALTGASHTAHEETAAAVDESAAQRSEQAAQAGHANEDEGEEEAYVEHDNRFQNNAQAAPLPLPSEPPPPPEEEEVDEEPLPPPSTAGASKKSAPVIASEGTATRAEQNKKLTSMVPMNVARSRQQNQ